MEKLILSLGLIISGLAIGYLLQRMDRAGTLCLPAPLPKCRLLLQKISLLGLMPISVLGAVWVVSFTDIRVLLLPVVGVTALLSGGLIGLGYAHFSNKTPKQTGVLLCCGSFTNIGAIGGLVCFLFLGEAGFALVTLYKMFEEIVYYTIGFPLARFYSGITGRQQSFAGQILGVLTDPFVFTALLAFFIGLGLNLSGITRPSVFETITNTAIPVGTFLLIVSIGLGMHFSSVGAYLKESLFLCISKFILVPMIAILLAYALGLHQIADGLPFKVVIILSSMPVAFNALVAASIYDLDLELANSGWLITTCALVIVLPWLYFLVS